MLRCVSGLCLSFAFRSASFTAANTQSTFASSLRSASTVRSVSSPEKSENSSTQ